MPAPTLAQTNRQFLEPPSNLPRIQGNLNLDRLFAALKVAPDDESAKYVENRIWALWIATDSDTTTLLMSRVKTAVDAKDLDLGIKLLTAIINIKPDYIEAWNRRATLYYMKKDFEDSLADIHEVLKREPRHFGALVGPGHDHAGGRRRQARARGLPPRARGASASGAHSGSGQAIDREGRRPRHLSRRCGASRV